MSAFKSLKSGWMRFVDAFMKFQTFIFLSIVYHLAVGPVSLLARLTGKPLMTLDTPGKKPTLSYLTPVERISTTIEEAEKQF